MSKTIDDRIVRMSFDTSKFQNGVKGVIDGLKSIDKSLDAKRTFSGLDGISKSIADVTGRGLSSLSASISESAGRFSALEVAGITALANISNKAVDAGLNMVKALTLDPIMDGFNEYELKMNSIQTILTNTASKGTTLDDVNKALGELNEYSDKTIYNFAQMTDNIGKATSAGVGLKDAVTFVKGMANVAAGFGVDATSMAGATMQMTQALSSGYIRLQDWVSMEQRGMGGEKIQQALKQTAKEMGVYVDESKPFRQTLQDNWLSSEVFIKTMDKMANDETLVAAAQNVTSLTKLFGVLKEAVGTGWATTFEQIFGGKDASTALFTGMNNAITSELINPMADARTAAIDMWLEMGGRTNTIKAFSNIWENLSRILGPIETAFSKIFPKTFGATLAYISKGFLALTEALMISEEFSVYIGDAFTFLFSTINTGIKVLGFLLQPLKYVFNSFVGIARVVGSLITTFIKMTYVIGDYVRELTFVKQAQELFNSGMEFINRNAEKFTKAFDGVVKGINDFYNGLINGINGLFEFDKSGKDVNKTLDTVVKSSSMTEKAMTGVSNISDFVIMAFESLVKAGSDIYKMYDDAKDSAENAADGFVTFVENTQDYINNSSIVARATETMVEAWVAMCNVGDNIKGFIKSIDFSPIVDTFNSVKEKLEPVVTYITNVFKIIIDAFKSLFDELDLTGGQLVMLLGGFAAGFGVFKVFGKIGEIIGNILNPIRSLSESASNVLQGVFGVLEAYQNRIQADTLKQIGIAVLMLSGGLLILSQLEMSEVQSGLLGVAGILASVVTALAVLIKITSGANLKGFFSLSAAFIALSIAVFNMSLAVMLLSSLGMEKLSVGLLGVAGSMTMLVLALGAVGTMEGKIVRGAWAMMLLASALGMMYISLTLFAKMDVQKMNNSLMSVGMSLGILVLATRGLNTITGNIPKTAAGLILLSTALILLVSACRKFGEMDTNVLKQGLSSIVIIIGAFTVFSALTSKSKMSFSMGTGMMGMAKALSMLIKPLQKLGEMDINELQQGIISLGLVMAGLTAMMNFLKPSDGWALIQVSIGLILLSQALTMFCKTAVKLKDISHKDMLSGLLNMALALTAVGIAITIIPEAQLWSLAGGIIALSVAFIALSKAVEYSGNMPMDQMLKGFLALAGGLLVLEYAFRLTPSTSLFKMGAGLVALSVGFLTMSVAVEKLGTFDFVTLAKGLGAILAMVGIMTLMNMGMTGMSLIPLAGGIMLLSLALTALYVPINLLGQLDLKTIGTGLLAISGVLAVLGLAAFLLTPVVPVLFGLATSIGLLGSGMLAASGGLTLFSAGFALFGYTVATFGSGIITFFVEFSKRLPELVQNLALAMVKLLEVLGQNGQLIADSLYKILEAILNAIISVIPLVANAIYNLIITIAETLVSNAARLAAAGYNLIMAILDGINKYVTPTISKMVEILITMANALVDNMNILVDAGMQLMVSLINGIAQGISANSDALNDAINNLLFSLLDAMVDFGVDFFKRGFDYIGEMIKGVKDNEKPLEKTSTNVAKSGVTGAKTTDKSWRSAGKDFSAGVSNGILDGKSGVVASATSMAKAAANAIKKELDINSPSKVTTEFGMFTSKGLANGIIAYGHLAARAGSDVAHETVRNIEKPINNISLLDGVDFNPVVRPVIDLSNVKSGSRMIGDLINNASGVLTTFGSVNGRLVTDVGNIQNRKDNTDIVSAISKLRKEIGNINNTTNIIEGITYDDGSNISSTIEDLVRIARVERRT